MTQVKTIAMLGGNGQVAAEVALLLQNKAEVRVRPISRSAGGSAFLRLSGVEVMLGDIANTEEAPSLLEGADVVANFALATGEPAKAIAANRQIIIQSFVSAPKNATIVFFSTAAVYGEYDLNGRRIKSFYGSMKLSNEKLVKKMSRKTGRSAYILRLGHVVGTYQNITTAIRKKVTGGPITVPYPERSANVTSTEAIADILISIAQGRAGVAGTYDLVNRPQWNWRQVIEQEAQICGVVPIIVGERENVRWLTNRARNLKASVAFLVSKVGIREVGLKITSHLPARVVEVIKAEYSITRARHAIGRYEMPPPLLSSALVWPAITPRYLEGQPCTVDLIEKGNYSIRLSADSDKHRS